LIISKTKGSEKMTFGELLKKKRAESGFTQRKVGEKIGKPYQYYQHWESGFCLPDFRTIKTLCRVLSITPQEAFDSIPSEEPRQ